MLRDQRSIEERSPFQRTANYSGPVAINWPVVEHENDADIDEVLLVLVAQNVSHHYTPKEKVLELRDHACKKRRRKREGWSAYA